MSRVLILGHTGKLGRELCEVFAAGGDEVVGRSRADFDAGLAGAGAAVVRDEEPDLVINTIAFQGIDRCFEDAHMAERINGVFPRELAYLTGALEIPLVHFSTECVFADVMSGVCVESTIPAPLNVYGMTKFRGEQGVLAAHRHAYVFRLPMLFGGDAGQVQFVERMVAKLKAGEEIAAADDLITSPTYVRDAAQRVFWVLEQEKAPGLYHIANAGEVSLFGLLEEIARGLGTAGRVRRASWRDFPSKERKNLRTPLASEKLPAMRGWREAAEEWLKLEG